MDIMHSRLYLCLKATGHSREIALIKYTGWLLFEFLSVLPWKRTQRRDCGDFKKHGWVFTTVQDTDTLESQESVQLLYSSSFTCLIFEVRACCSKQSPFSRCAEKSWQSRESLGSRNQSSPASKLLHLVIGKEHTDCPSGASIWIWGIRWNAEYDKGFGNKKGNHSQKISFHMASFYLPQWPVRCFCFSLCFQSLWSEKKEQLETTFLKAVVKEICICPAHMEDNQSNSHFLLEGFSHMNCKISEVLSLSSGNKSYKEALF